MRHRKEDLEKILLPTIDALNSESPDRRPVDEQGKPGGLILLNSDLPVIIVPDLHGRHEFIRDLLDFKYQKKKVLELLKADQIQIVCVGDGMHGEARVAKRWRKAFQEYKQGFSDCPEMTAEMTENFRTMSLILYLKTNFPHLFHFLKGNHENVMDENGNGNHPFAKFSAEGPMTKEYITQFYGEDFLELWSQFEKKLPLMAQGASFLITHSRPRRAYSIDEVINCYSQTDVIEGLTWTRDQATEARATNKMLDEIIGTSVEKRYWFSGHSAITLKYKEWQEEKLIQLHNPKLQMITIIDPAQSFDPAAHIIQLPRQKKGLFKWG